MATVGSVVTTILQPIALTTPYRSDNGALVSTPSLWLGDQEDVSEEEDVNNHLQCEGVRTNW